MNYDRLTFDWDSLYKSFIPKVINTKNDYNYYRQLKKFASFLNDAHTGIYDNGQFSGYCDYTPISLTNINNKVYITGYRDNIKDELKLGAEITEVNDIPIKQYMKEYIFPFMAASTEQSLWANGVSKIGYGLRSDPVKLKYKTNVGKKGEVFLKRNGESTWYDNEGKEKFKSVGIKRKEFKLLDLSFTEDSIAILEYNAFYPETLTSQLEKLLPEIYNANGFIIDLRKNTGGSTIVAKHLLRYLIKTDYFLGYGWETKTHDAVRKAMGYGYDEYKDYFEMNVYRSEKPDTFFIPEDIKRIYCPTVILIENHTCSAAEDFLLMLYEIDERPLLIGTPTAGSTGAPLVIPDFPGGGYARICTRRCKFPYSGKLFVNEGIIPDIEIYPTIEDVLASNDIVMKKAIEEINKKLVQLNN